jgi:transcriptional regulator with XRE-family HTH domain
MSAADSIDPNSSLWAWLAHDLRFYREKHGLSLAQLGRIMGRTRGSVSNCEAGRRRITEQEARILDRHWDTGGHFLRLLTFAKAGHDPDWFKQHLEYESKATVLKIYELAVVPGLLQTPDYAHASFTAAGLKNEDLDRELTSRMSRQEALEKPNPPTVWVLLDEGVLDHEVGSADVMKGQLFRLLEVSERHHVTLRVVPRTVGWHFGFEGAFKILTVDTGDVAYTEACGGGRLVTDPVEVRAFTLRHDRIGAWALPVDSSQALIVKKMEAKT